MESLKSDMEVFRSTEDRVRKDGYWAAVGFSLARILGPSLEDPVLTGLSQIPPPLFT